MNGLPKKSGGDRQSLLAGNRMAARLGRSSFQSKHVEESRHVSDSVAAVEKDYSDGIRLAAHQHVRAQVLYAMTGILRISTAGGIFVMPPLRALWIPPGTCPEIFMVGRVRLRTIYFDPGFVTGLGTECRTIEVTNFLRELILRMFPFGRTESGLHDRNEPILKLISQELQRPSPLSIRIPLPRDPRLLKICHGLIRDPASDDSLEDWALRVGVSSRTAARHFKAETGLTFGMWRQNVRLSEALAHLASGEAVAQVACRVGYGSSTAFIAMFHRVLGKTPQQYCRSCDPNVDPPRGIEVMECNPKDADLCEPFDREPEGSLYATE